MSSTSPLGKLLLKWKTLKLPWRKRWLAGWDLAGNSYWYFKPTRSSPARRILKADPRIAYSDIQIPRMLMVPFPSALDKRLSLSLLAQWHQWLRYTRPSPPSVAEQQSDAVRQIELKRLAQAADERWALKPSVLDKPRANAERLPGGDLVETREISHERGEEGERKATEEPRGKQKESPWKGTQGNPGEHWQPQAWTPGIQKR